MIKNTTINLCYPGSPPGMGLHQGWVSTRDGSPPGMGLPYRETNGGVRVVPNAQLAHANSSVLLPPTEMTQLNSAILHVIRFRVISPNRIDIKGDLPTVHVGHRSVIVFQQEQDKYIFYRRR